MDLNIAPADVLIRYLSVFSRFFPMVHQWCEGYDHGGIFLTGHAARSLHNVPEYLSHYRENWWDGWFPFDATSWVVGLRARGMPEHLVNEWGKIFISAMDQEQLLFSSDAKRLDLPPAAVFNDYMDVFEDACLTLRILENFHPRPTPWEFVDKPWPSRGVGDVAGCGVLAQALSPLPLALLHWSDFDERGFLESKEICRCMNSGLLRSAFVDRRCTH